jgi:PPOX class probable F420-dependent enzyme
VSRRTAIQMPEDAIEAYLRSRQFMAVATHGPRGWPHLVTVRYGWRGDDLAFQGYSKSQKIVNLRRDPRLTCLVEDAMDYHQIKGVQIEATAELIEDPAVALEVMRTSLLHAPKAMNGTSVDSLESISGKRTVVIIRRNRMLSWDHARLEGGY